MAVWYCSSAAYTAIPQFAISHAYTVGNIIRALAAPAAGSRGVFRCTTAGTSAASEPSWPQNNNGTVTTGGATFTTVSGQSTYGWGAAAGDVNTLCNASATVSTGDTIYISSDHSATESSTALFSLLGGGTWNATTFLISVNRGGSVPPVAGDITSGAAVTQSSAITFAPVAPAYVQGVTFTASAGNISVSSGFPVYLKNCALVLSSAAAFALTTNAPATLTLDNTTIQFGGTGQGVKGVYPFYLTWINTSAAIQGATIPTFLFPFNNSTNGALFTCRGVDFSAITTTLVQSAVSGGGIKALLDSCKIAPGVTVLSATLPNGSYDAVELVNCYDGTNIRNERYTCAGSVVTERTITLTGGAADDIGAFSHKMVSKATGLDQWAVPLEGFWFDVENQAIGVSHIATVEIVSSASLNNNDISLLLEYQGTSGSSVASFASSLPATPLTSNAAVPTSTATWNSSPATPVYQHLQITFTPQRAGRVRGQVKLGKLSTTVYVNPQITVT